MKLTKTIKGKLNNLTHTEKKKSENRRHNFDS